MPSVCCLVLALLLVSSASAYLHYQDKIPNGDNVNHPCLPNKIWQGVGHFNKGGGGSKNSFGTDFAAAGHKWTKELCMKDSDGDGRTNGDELGDPKCVWKEGSIPERTKDISHPGACQPLDSAKCKARNGDWKQLCKSDKLNCPAINSSDVFNMTLRFPRTNIPKKVTNYYCQAFALPNDTDYHMIANEPVIDNSEVMHHALVFGCLQKPEDRFFNGPIKCGMGGNGCSQLIGIWGLGLVGECLPSQYGILIGKNGYKYVVVQFHWNNVKMRSDLWDQSAMRLYLSKNIRNNHGTILMSGQRYLEIAARQSVVTQEATCTSDCTRHKLNQTIMFTDILAHMHYAGTHAEAYHYRDGKKINTLLPYTRITYDEPRKYMFKTPIEFRPGDEIKMKCYFKTATKTSVLYYGDSTQDEMCFIFMSYYPNQYFSSCLNYGSVDMCGSFLPKHGARDGLPGNIGNNCNVADFVQTRLPKTWMPLLREFCDYSISACRTLCMDVLKRMDKEEPCWNAPQKKYLEFLMVRYPKSYTQVSEARWRLSTCAIDTNAPKPSVPSPPPKDGEKMSKMLAILIGVGCAMVGLLVIVVAVIGILKMRHGKNPQAQGLDNKGFDPPATNF